MELDGLLRAVAVACLNVLSKCSELHKGHYLHIFCVGQETEMSDVELTESEAQ